MNDNNSVLFIIYTFLRLFKIKRKMDAMPAMPAEPATNTNITYMQLCMETTITNIL